LGLRGKQGAANIYEGDAAKKWSEPTAFPLDLSVYGVYDMAGNVSDWTATIDRTSGQPIIRGGNSATLAQISRGVLSISLPRHRAIESVSGRSGHDEQAGALFRRLFTEI